MFSVYCSSRTDGTLMAKRRAEDKLQPDPPSKRLGHSCCGVDAPPETAPPAGGESPRPSPSPSPEPPPRLGSRCRKRPHDSEDQQQEAAGVCPKTGHGDTRRRLPAKVSTGQTSGGFQDRGRSSPLTNLKKRAREDCAETVSPSAADTIADGGTDVEDCTYNSFQFWRVPLPELDLSLLEDVSGRSQHKSKAQDSSVDVMET